MLLICTKGLEVNPFSLSMRKLFHFVRLLNKPTREENGYHKIKREIGFTTFGHSD